MKVHLQDQVKNSTGLLENLTKDSNWKFAPVDLVSFLMILTQDMKFCPDYLFHFLMSMTQDKELCSGSLFHF